MKKRFYKKDDIKGVSLFEMLLTLAIIATILSMFVSYSAMQLTQSKQTMAAQQMQQILNAALVFYQNKGKWPDGSTGTCSAGYILDSNSDLDSYGYLPPFVSVPYSNQYTINCDTNTGVFLVSTTVDTDLNAGVIASMVPMGLASTGGNVTAQVQIPGQNLNNARSMNFAGVYYSGSCVPAPVCPLGMTPKIFVAPSGVSGVNSPPTNCDSSTTNPPYNPSGCQATAYPISSFLAFARGDTNGNPVSPGTWSPASASSSGGPLDCEVQSAGVQQGCEQDQTGTALDSTAKYWRVCLFVRTVPNGQVNPGNGTPASTTNVPWGKLMGTVVAFTRCVPSNEPTGSMDVWQTNNGGNP